MKKFLFFVLAFCLVAVWSTSASAVNWPANSNERVQTMGDAILVIEDESTALNLFNHRNPSGVALLDKKNRLDLGFGYDAENYTVSDSVGGVDWEEKQDFSNITLPLPLGEAKGITYWLDESLVLRGALDVSLFNFTYNYTQTGVDDVSEKFNMSTIGGTAGLGYKTDIGLALGALLSYHGLSGKPDKLDGMFNVVNDISPSGGETTKLEVSGSNFLWSIGVGYVTDQVGENNKLSLGASVGADDEPLMISDFSGLLSGSLSPLTVGDYNLIADIEGTMNAMPPYIPETEVTAKMTMTTSPLKIAAEGIFNVNKIVDIGLLFDYKMRSNNLKQEMTAGGTAQDTIDYKIADQSGVGISPVVKANFGIGEGSNLLAGLSYSTLGSGKIDVFSLDGTTSDINDTYKSEMLERSQGNLSLGAGVQLMEKMIQVGLQYDMGTRKDSNTAYDVNGDVVQQYNKDNELVDTVSTDYTTSALRIGAEVWVIPMLALRLGYAMLTEIEKEGYWDTDENDWVDDKDLTSRLTFGLGLSLPEGLRADLLVKLDTYTQDPVRDPEPKHSKTGIFVACHLPL